MPKPFDRAIIYKLALSRPQDSEPSLWPTVFVFPAPDDLEIMASPAIFARGFEILDRALRKHFPNSEYTVISPVGPPAQIDIGGGWEEFVPEFEEDDWRVFIEREL